MTSLIIQNLQKTDTYSSNQYFNRDFFATSYSKAIWLSRFKSRVNSASLTKGIFLMKFSIFYISIFQWNLSDFTWSKNWVCTCELQALVSYDASSLHPAHIVAPNWLHVRCDRALLSSFDEGLLSSSEHAFTNIQNTNLLNFSQIFLSWRRKQILHCNGQKRHFFSVLSIWEIKTNIT